MSQSPRKCISNFTVNRGVEAREFQIENPRLVADADAWSGGGAQGAPSEHSASFVQVVVHKQRVPAASSPAADTAAATATAAAAAAAAQQPARPPASRVPLAAATVDADALLAAALAALQRRLWDKLLLPDAPVAPDAPDTPDAPDAPEAPRTGDRRGAGQKTLKKNIWNQVSRLKSQDLDFGTDAARIEVYRFERGAALVCARRAAPATRVERAARRLARPARVLLAELLGALRVLAAAPAHAVLQLARCAAEGAGAAAGGALAAASDALLKPLLTQTFNALLRPPLLLLGATCGALRDALLPAALLLGDALEAAARPLAALRLVHVQCACRAPLPV